MRILVLGLGNDLIADDAAGPIAVRRMREAWQALEAAPPSARVEFVESSVSGVALLEDLVGHDRALIIDAVATGRAPPGTIHVLRPDDLGPVVAPSPHYAGLPEMLTLARELALDFPAEVSILGLEVVDPHTIGGPLSGEVTAALPALVERGLAQVRAWLGGE
jgi:hydrogenase maturation protease